ncbi:hypothetical protein IQ13_0101 [Lacibacter cauensis]|uniref:Uncharacterized protein n=1 Tax=Lacibacter cauensis TaxID=510947 RepID=A0A562SV35_9BACT|nr:hypothetical protein [Lacibacter cauensis]TWI84948.1 hypothetical protein IQ13_0101 [Lacibacter cauensis]
MHIQLHDLITLREIKSVFSSYYPYLRLEFYSVPHKIFEASAEKDILPDDVQLQTIKAGHTDGIIDIMPTEKVADLEREFQVRFDLPVQVLRMEHGEWTQTTGMDSFTLKDVNEYSRLDSDEYVIQDEEENFND